MCTGLLHRFSTGAITLGVMGACFSAIPRATAQPVAPVFEAPAVFMNGLIDGADPFGIAAGDIDNDGDLDVAVAYHNVDAVQILYNTGDWTPPQDGFVFDVNNPYFVDVCGNGFDQDRLTEVAFAHIGLNGSTPDAYLDLVVLSTECGYLAVGINDGTGHFAAPEYFFPSLYPMQSLVVADFDLNGRTDVAIVGAFFDTQDRPAVEVFWQELSGATFTPQMYVFSSETGHGWDGDVEYFNELALPGGGDMLALILPDIALTNDTNARVHIMINQGDRDFQLRSFQAVPSFGISVAPLDAGAKRDLAITHLDTAPLSETRWLQGSGTGNFTLKEPPYDSGHPRPYGIDAGKLNGGDTRLDLAVANQGDGLTTHGNVSVFVNTGNAADLFVGYDFDVGVPSPKPCQVLLADLDNDGHLDIITSNTSAPDAGPYDSISVLINALP
ncbi:MAG: hypothetical protein CHACPFDD_02486 [Phycisphaerae bacterium]|nr:hypothetical protein [Phycisphaerae bacterium]